MTTGHARNSRRSEVKGLSRPLFGIISVVLWIKRGNSAVLACLWTIDRLLLWIQSNVVLNLYSNVSQKLCQACVFL